MRSNEGTPISSEAVKQRVIIFLRAVVERKSSEGVRLELFKSDKPSLLAEVTRTFRENLMNVTEDEISTVLEIFSAWIQLKAQGLSVGSSLVEEDRLKLATTLLAKAKAKAKAKGVSLLSPTDVVIAGT
ncbi:ACT domain-containing protein ACR8-like protein [Tanacetum coccineum]